MRRTLPSMLICALAFVLAMIAAAGPASAACVRDVAGWDTLRVRTGPGTGFTEVGGILPGACGVVVRGACRGAWCPVAYGRIAGWSNARFLDSASRQSNPLPARRQSVASSGACVRGLPARQTLKVRASPSPSGELLYGFHNGTCGVRIVGACTDGFCQVEYRSYRGWVDSRYLR